MAFNKEKALSAAKKHIQKGHIDRAILEYKKVVEHDPYDIKHLQKLAELYVMQGSRQEAISVFLTLGDLLIKQGFSNRAISIYKQILQLNPLLIPVYIKLSEIFQTLGLSKDARLFNQRAVEIVQKAGSIEDVYKLLIKIIEIDPEDAVSRIALAETCFKMKNTKTAVEQFEAALPILRQQHLDDLFIRAAERLLFHEPNNVELCRELAILHMNRKEIPKSMKLLLHCRKLDPADLDTLDLLIAHFLSMENNEKAILVLLEKGKLLNMKGQGAEAEEVFRKVLKIDPNNEEAIKHVTGEEAYSWDDIHPPKPPPPPPPPKGASPPPSPGTRLDTALQEEIELKFINEAEIFIKYGLRQKALEHLFRGLEETNSSLKVREKLKDLYLDVGEINLGVEQLHLLTQLTRSREPGKAQLYLKEILLINPNDLKASKMLQSINGSLGSSPAEIIEEAVVPLERVKAPPAGKDYRQGFLDEETSDIVESIDRIDSIHDLEEPFKDASFPPPVSASDEISSEELRALDTETSEEISIEDFSSLDRVTTDDIASDELSTLETETSQDFISPPEDEDGPTGSSIELSRGPRPPSIDQVLDEADFFSAQGLAQEAMLLLEDLLAQFPDNRLLLEKLEEFKQKGAASDNLQRAASPAEASTGQEISVSQATDEAIEELGALEKIISPMEVNEPMNGALTATPAEIDAADAQTHYDLAIAYIEMGLWDQAIGELRISAQNPHREATSYNLIGTCFINSGNIEEAIKEYKMGLFSKKKTAEQEMNLYYDIANAYVQMKDFKEALYYFQNIKKKYPEYKDVSSRIVEITSTYNKSIGKMEESAEKKKVTATPRESAKEVDDAFDNLFGDFPKKK